MKKAVLAHPGLPVDCYDEGKLAGRHRIARIMKDNGWRAKAARKYKATTNSKHSLPVAPNLLEQDFSADKPDQKWVSDITYIWTEEGWLYLAVVLELYSRRVIGWAISERMTARLVCDALIMALWNTNMPKGVIVHSDRGSQYCSAVYQKLFRKHQLICSMSKKATVMITPLWKVGTIASRSKQCMANASGPARKPSIRCSNISKCITIANGFIQNWATLARKLLKLKKSLSGVSVKSVQDHISHITMRFSCFFTLQSAIVLKKSVGQIKSTFFHMLGIL